MKNICKITCLEEKKKISNDCKLERLTSAFSLYLMSLLFIDFLKNEQSHNSGFKSEKNLPTFMLVSVK